MKDSCYLVFFKKNGKWEPFKEHEPIFSKLHADSVLKNLKKKYPLNEIRIQAVSVNDICIANETADAIIDCIEDRMAEKLVPEGEVLFKSADFDYTKFMIIETMAKFHLIDIGDFHYDDQLWFLRKSFFYSNKPVGEWFKDLYNTTGYDFSDKQLDIFLEQCSDKTFSKGESLKAYAKGELTVH